MKGEKIMGVMKLKYYGVFIASIISFSVIGQPWDIFNPDYKSLTDLIEENKKSADAKLNKSEPENYEAIVVLTLANVIHKYDKEHSRQIAKIQVINNVILNDDFVHTTVNVAEFFQKYCTNFSGVAKFPYYEDVVATTRNLWGIWGTVWAEQEKRVVIPADAFLKFAFKDSSRRADRVLLEGFMDQFRLSPTVTCIKTRVTCWNRIVKIWGENGLTSEVIDWVKKDEKIKGLLDNYADLKEKAEESKKKHDKKD